ncbi:MAG TPA: NAD(P)H-hydrate dehydratase, partial [Methylomirabilota bacterium]|nr:NAD(P)H-hydrate dehydratase [Methylomirabilota bacterium]
GAVGALLVRQIGSPPQLVEEIGRAAIRMAEPGEFGELPYVRAADSHKGSFGHVLLVCGSLGKGGAAALAGRGALRAGAGLVTIATADQVQASVAAGAAEYMAEALPSTDAGTISPASLEYGRFAKLLEGKSVLGVGPGLGTHLETQQFIRSIVRDATLPVVLDADGLNAFAGRGFELLGDRERTLAITPHPGEMARLLGVSASAVQANRLTTAQEASARWRIFVVLKGFHTLIVAPEGYAYVSTAGNAGLAKGGTGDTLTGVLAALTAQFGTRDWARVLALGVFLHGRAAELATAGKEPSGLLASEVCEFIPAARLELLRELQRSA